MSFNVWASGKSVHNGLEKIARHVKFVRPDIVAMQSSKIQSAPNKEEQKIDQNILMGLGSYN
ncbi:unnamed protein product [Strongylus vulgaris]|uniref:Endonuclease/exonuclease/phosphatase domain-containing protein n=1 Tax=Strongylus vulgaris TaxID=40348 RepID=A0A3P7HZV2_STRVU|nr:unnamed protein product [Strongylus vulgaris]